MKIVNVQPRAKSGCILTLEFGARTKSVSRWKTEHRSVFGNMVIERTSSVIRYTISLIVPQLPTNCQTATVFAGKSHTFDSTEDDAPYFREQKAHRHTFLYIGALFL